MVVCCGSIRSSYLSEYSFVSMCTMQLTLQPLPGPRRQPLALLLLWQLTLLHLVQVDTVQSDLHANQNKTLVCLALPELEGCDGPVVVVGGGAVAVGECVHVLKYCMRRCKHSQFIIMATYNWFGNTYLLYRYDILVWLSG